jgi:preprotein translocase subunit Sec61beta
MARTPEQHGFARESIAGIARFYQQGAMKQQPVLP